ncbi:hypothetical protein AAZX31_10G222400 [Glycine max]|uniref:PAR1 protein n=2 Tax=Glycine subgen. Soja TaxID=1462606 RepID=C6TF83_SOYBN|nr:uncharacterized protein LOC100787709 precursor [Glycine max]XP_028183728.1 uncharacterized protein LOC114370545 [Glycine soja]ACU20485.1 unknown [Glycine max]KAG4984184.1 hypothetical protein JHK87_028933 [Glycine soja]KAG4998237.1 hypothetical protein JHK85_029676 [Glycine max]KAG5004994.1 hypothetical protein JHK86_029133 [Glycine max]KAG5128185.1 hypothetical protein JHK82_029020 [Glycine max]|eukprot:NP_001241627.1 uncharacterized protein LOC100787709 precursor [Glycine max]
MASNFSLRTLMIFSLAFWLALKGTLGGIECETLSHDTCSFAVSSAGKRCVLEKRVKRTGEEAYTCRTSEIEADKLKDHIETEQCIKACGLDRKSLGISSDSLLESTFTQKLCSPHCYQCCPNVVDLYFNLAAGEGVFLPKLCEAQGVNARRGMAELKSSGIVAPGPVHGVQFAAAPPINPVELTIEPAVAPSAN